MNYFKPIKTRKIYEEIVEQIRQLIKDGELNPGDRLLSERELCERLQVSRASVREALSALEIMGLIEVKPGEGTFIRQTSVDSIIGPMALILSMEKDTIMELLEVRKVLEVEAAGLAAERATQEELDEMGEALEEMIQDLNEGKLGENADHKLHYAIYKATHNSVLLRLMNTISDSMEKNIRTNRQRLYALPGNPEKLLKEHAAIAKAIGKRDAEKARECMYEHLDRAEKAYESFFREDKAKK
ncbi:MAG TPA: FadR/GntR family transcriptional regulator [Candidatus Deferrimicrobium sp.]|nr:FadR/GntR family transcriptional regulator [Candidatus Deferrimicrobium sp.]